MVVMCVVLSPAITLLALIPELELEIRTLLSVLTMPGIHLIWWELGREGGVAHSVLMLASNIKVLV